MKLLVSDYDNTIELHYNYTDNLGILKRNIIALNQFMENNILCIATGRHFDAINTTLRENKISFSYLCSNNGAELYDKNYSLLYCLPIDDYDLKKLSNLERIIIFRHPYNNDSIISSANIYIDEFEKFIEIKNYLNLNLKYSKIEYKFPKIKILNKQCDKVNIIDIIKKSNCIISTRKREEFALDNIIAIILNKPILVSNVGINKLIFKQENIFYNSDELKEKMKSNIEENKDFEKYYDIELNEREEILKSESI